MRLLVLIITGIASAGAILSGLVLFAAHGGVGEDAAIGLVVFMMGGLGVALMLAAGHDPGLERGDTDT